VTIAREGAVLLTSTGGVTTLTLNRPASRNALSVELATALRSSLEWAVDDAETRVIVITNLGPTFCAGGDLRTGTGQTGSPPAFVDALELILTAAKPVVGRIAGDCMGGGVGLAAACDISIAAASARIGFREVRLGVAPAVISVVCLPKLRRGDALELFLTGDRISATRAVEVGLLNRVAPDAELDAAVSQVVDDLLHGGPLAITVAKQLVSLVPAMDRAAAFAWTSQRSAELFASSEAAEGIAAFRERRPARWAPGAAQKPS
jgi:methylglutaconyl-CoA hydratase